MDHIDQLKAIRAEAIARIRNSKDFKLAGKLGVLIMELGEEVDDSLEMDGDAKAGDDAAPFSGLPGFTPAADAEDEMVEQLKAGMEEEVEDTTASIGPFLRSSGVSARANGADD